MDASACGPTPPYSLIASRWPRPIGSAVALLRLHFVTEDAGEGGLAVPRVGPRVLVRDHVDVSVAFARRDAREPHVAADVGIRTAQSLLHVHVLMYVKIWRDWYVKMWRVATVPCGWGPLPETCVVVPTSVVLYESP